MKIAYWSNEKGQAGTTANMAAISVMLAMGEQKRSVLFENHYNANNLEKMLVRNDISMVREDGYYYSQRGMDYLMRQLSTGKTAQAVVKQVSVPLLHNHIHYIPQSPIVNKEVFAYQMQQMLFPILNCLEQTADFVSVDAETGGNASTSMILSQADVVVVNLSQNPVALEHCFTNYASLQHKAVYIIGNYRADKEYTLDKILKEFPVNKERIGIIPHSEEFSDALHHGRLIGFLAKNYQCGNFHKNYPLIRECKNCARMIAEFRANPRSVH